jgi:hypothetical protein
MRPVHAVLGLVFALLVACHPRDPDEPVLAPYEYDVKLAAEQDFDCFRDEITVTAAGPEQYEAKGCGKQGRYAVKCSPQGDRGGTNCTAHAIEPEESGDEDPPAEAEEGE